MAEGNLMPTDNSGLMAILSGLQSGMDPATAYGMYQDVQQQQQYEQEQRQARLSGLTGMLQEAALGGMPYQGAEAMMQAQPGPMGPALQSALEAFYPTGGPAPTNANGQVMDFPTGSGAEVGSGGFGGQAPQGAPNPYAAAGAQPVGPNAMSVAYQPPTPTISEQLAMQQQETEMAAQQQQTGDLTMFQAEAAKARSKQWPLEQFLAAVQKKNPQLFAQYPDEVEAIINMTYGSAALQTMGMPGLGQ